MRQNCELHSSHDVRHRSRFRVLRASIRCKSEPCPKTSAGLRSDMDKSPESKEEPIIPGLYKMGAFVLFLVWLTTLVVLVFAGSKVDKAASIGDAFGSLNALFSILALSAAIAGTLIQGKEFRKQVEEMTKSSVEMEKQTLTYQAQLKELQMHSSILQEQLHQEKLRSMISELPLFSGELVEAKPPALYVNFTNEGAAIYDVFFSVRRDDLARIGISTNYQHENTTYLPRLKSAEIVFLVFTFEVLKQPVLPLYLTAEYTLQSGARLAECIEIVNGKMPLTKRDKQISTLDGNIRHTKVRAG